MKHGLLFAAFAGLVGGAIATHTWAASEAKPTATKPAASAAKPAASPIKLKPARTKASKPSQTATKPAPEPAPEPMAEVELGRLFRGKTWLWPDGAAYFGPKGRFVAWSGKGEAASFANGWWGTSPKGRLCFSASWISRAGTNAAETCFAHAVKSGDLLQKKEPVGDWYVFKHKEALPEDEYGKLVTGDQASPEVQKVMAAVRSR